MSEEKVPIPKLRSSDCFACGAGNPIGLKMELYRQGGSVCSDVVLSRNHVGWQNMAHGGIISTLLDETMSWTVICFKKSFAVTRRMEVRYLRPVPCETPLRVKGEIVSDGSSRTCQASAVLLDSDGRTLAKAEGQFALLGEERLSLLPEDLREEMLAFFAELA